MNTHMQNEQNELEQNISELVAIKNEYIDDLSILYYDLDNAIVNMSMMRSTIIYFQLSHILMN